MQPDFCGRRESIQFGWEWDLKIRNGEGVPGHRTQPRHRRIRSKIAEGRVESIGNGLRNKIPEEVWRGELEGNVGIGLKFDGIYFLSKITRSAHLPPPSTTQMHTDTNKHPPN